jgi:hypothetical protein
VTAVPIGRWHWGKLVILWAWGGVGGALLLARFLSAPADASPMTSAFAFLGSFTVLVGLSIITWIWLGGKES